jgi:hypothetical protein
MSQVSGNAQMQIQTNTVQDLLHTDHCPQQQLFQAITYLTPMLRLQFDSRLSAHVLSSSHCSHQVTAFWVLLGHGLGVDLFLFQLDWLAIFALTI